MSIVRSAPLAVSDESGMVAASSLLTSTLRWLSGKIREGECENFSVMRAFVTSSSSRTATGTAISPVTPRRRIGFC